MNRFRLSLLAVLLVTLSACAGNEHCDKQKLYSSAQLNDPISIPEDLDAPAANKDLRIPQAAPKPPRDEDAGCVESPPLLPTSVK